jgi:glyoxylate/hydroxypyruvate reductase A
VAVLFHCPWENASDWFQALAAEMPDEDLRRWPDAGNPEDIDFAIVWQLPDNVLRSFPNLKGISSMGAGVDGLMADPTLPEGVPVARLVDPIMSARMAEYAASTALYYHLRQHEYAEQHSSRTWLRLPPVDAPDRPVGVLGLGAMGLAAARMLKAVGFDVMGWSRSPRQEDGIRCFSGPDGLDEILSRSQIVVLLLPHTPETGNLMNADRLGRMPRGAFLINCARGDLIVDGDLLAALDSGQLAHATLDVFRTEPLPDDHPFWRHPKIRITPHVSSLSEPTSGVKILAEQVRRARRGEPLLHRAEPSRGY